MGKNSEKYEGELKIDSEFMSALIGFSGSNIRRITSIVKDGCYIRGDNDTIKVSAYSSKAVKRAIDLLKKDVKFFTNPITNKRFKRYYDTMDADLRIVSILIGKNGVGLYNIIKEVDELCFIIYKDGKYKLFANSEENMTKLKFNIANYEHNILERFYDSNKQIPEIPEIIENNKDDSNNITSRLRKKRSSSEVEDNNYNDYESPTYNKKIKLSPETSPTSNKIIKMEVSPNKNIWNKNKTQNIIKSINLDTQFVDSENVINTRLKEQLKKEKYEKQLKEDNEFLNKLNNKDWADYSSDSENSIF